MFERVLALMAGVAPESDWLDRHPLVALAVVVAGVVLAGCLEMA